MMNSRILNQFQALKKNPFNSVLRCYNPEQSTARIGPLAGLSFVVKDNISIAHQPLSVGLRPPLLECCTETAQVVQRILEAGAICLASTNLDELATDIFGHNRYYGDMMNPLNSSRLALGSSAGTAICVEQNAADFGLGTDFGGSVRAPAAACGNYGLKLNSSTFSRTGIFFLSDTLDSLGIISNSLEILTKSTQAILATVPPRQTEKIERIYVPNSMELQFLSPEYYSHFMSIKSQLSKSFEVVEAACIFEMALNARKILAVTDIAKAIAPYSNRSDSFHRSMLAILNKSESLENSEIEMAIKQKNSVSNWIRENITKDALLVSPSLPFLPPLISERHSVTAPINIYLTLANLVDCAAISLPTHKLLSNKIPFSIQIIGGLPSELSLLEAAKLFEAQLA